MSQISVVIVDDHLLFRESLGALLDKYENLAIIALCENGEQAVEVVRAENPGVVLMDIQMPVMSGIMATQQIAAFSAAHIIGLSMHTEPALAMGMIKAGAKGYVSKNSSVDEIANAIFTVVKGQKYIAQTIRNSMADAAIAPAAGQPVQATLTAKQAAIIQLISEGKTSKEISRALGISAKTVEVHRYNIRKKFKAKNGVSMINIAWRHNKEIFLPRR